MQFLDEFRDPALADRLLKEIRRQSPERLRLMEFCGGHTVSVMKHGLRQLLAPEVALLSGPGCPVCVTPNSDLDKALAMAKEPGITLATFGDMVKVPGSYSSLQQVRAEGGDVRIVYSAQDALNLAESDSERSVVLVGIGFETTAPTVAASILEASERGIKNYFVFSCHRLCPPVIRALLESGEIRIDGILLPGHVSAVIGSRPYEFAVQAYGIGGVVAGFEPLDILLAVLMLVTQKKRGAPGIEIAYRRGVRPEGNPKAQEIMERVFEKSEAVWRGVGVVPESGLKLRKEYRNFDAEHVFQITVPPSREPVGCRCGDILRGVKTPSDCSLFGRTCTPEKPVGPCMVSSEGSCAAHYLYGERDGR